MLTVDQAPALARHLAASPRDAAGLGDAVDWKQSGWPTWSTYQPIADAALDAGLRIVAAELGAASKQALRKDGLAGLDADLVARYGLDQPLAKEHEAAMATEIREAHCDQAPASVIPRMVAAQRARDAHMAEALVRAADPDGAVLITGAGHARSDWGVPAYLRRRQPDASIAAVAFLEARTARQSAAEYAEDFHLPTLPFDYVWFTPRVDEDDPCEKFKKSLERMRQQR
jgi:uncharacterized iron-regulated protein